MFDIINFLVLLFLGYSIGSILEHNHYRSIRSREAIFLNLPAVTTKGSDINEKEVQSAELVYGSAVISIDFFKKLMASLINLFGGRVSVYETLVDRARREAILRMKESALNADIIVNLRLETSSISKNSNTKNSVGAVEVLAYGTAITLGKK